MDETINETMNEIMDGTNPAVEEAQARDDAALQGPTPPGGFRGKIDKFFGITAAGSNFKRETLAGLTTFITMVYILMINAGMLGQVIPAESAEAAYGAAYIATAMGAVAGTMLMAFLARMPLAQASGLGISAFIVYTLILGGTGLSYANCLVFTLFDGVIFILLTVTGLRKKIFAAIPAGIRNAIPVGIGLFIAFIGMQNAGIIVADGSTLVSFVSFNLLGDNTYFNMAGALVALLGVVAIAVMIKKDVKGAILWGILGSTALYYALTGIGAACGSEACLDLYGGFALSDPFAAFAAWGKYSAGALFTEGFDFSAYLAVEGHSAGTLIVLLFSSALSLGMIAMFDTIGTLYATCDKAKLLDEHGAPIRMQHMMLSDAVASCVGAVAGTSTVTTLSESASGVAAGGRTGFTSLVTGVLFLIAMPLSPVARLIPACATAGALLWVGVLMMSSVTKIDWSDPGDSLVAFLTFVIMLLGYSISKGIGVGILAYILIKLCTGKIREITPTTYVVGALFLTMFLLT